MKKILATLILIFALISCDDPKSLDENKNEILKEVIIKKGYEFNFHIEVNGKFD